MEDFKSFNKIPRLEQIKMSITQKLDGTNAQIYIAPVIRGWEPAECGYQDYNVFAGSRNRWLTLDNDNFGFCRWVVENRKLLIETLGEGRHYGEWCGPGINNGEGLQERTLFMFNWRRWGGVPGCGSSYFAGFNNQLRTVPCLYVGALNTNAIIQTYKELKKEVVDPEGLVIEIGDRLYKLLYEREDKPREKKAYAANLDITHLLQPARLKKLLSKDEEYTRDYPSTLTKICQDYVNDLKFEEKLTEEEEKALRRGCIIL